MAESSVNQELMNESAVKQDLIYLVLQFLRESQFNESLHELESQSRVFFDMQYFEKLMLECKWEEAERYLSGFTKVDENTYSLKLFCIIRAQKYFEALDNHDKAKAVEILEKELKFIFTTCMEGFEKLTRFLILDDTRKRYGCSYIMSFRDWYLLKAKDLIMKNPVLCNKLEFPIIENERLQTLLRQSFNDQHSRCKNKVTCPEMILEDHTCDRYAAEQEAKERRIREINLLQRSGSPFSPAHFF